MSMQKCDNMEIISKYQTHKTINGKYGIGYLNSNSMIHNTKHAA